MSDGPDPAERAALWAARRTDPTPLSDDESAAYTAWLAADPANGRQLAALERAWRDPHVREAASRIAAARARHRLGRRAALGLGATTFAAGALWLGQAPLRRALADRATAVGQVASFPLDTDAQVTLDTASALVREGLQNWRLVEGAVRLDLKRDAACALSGAHVRITADGASVTLRRHPGSDRVAVLAGRVLADGLLVPAGQGATFGTGHGLPRPEPLGAGERDEAEGFAEAWHRYKDAPLSALLSDLARYRLAPLWATEDAGRLRVSGRFRFLDPDRVLTALAATLPIGLQRLGPVMRVFLR